MMAWKKKKTKESLEIPKPQDEQAQPQQNVEEREAVVNELPQISARKVQGEDGHVYSLVTQNEAVEEILQGIRELLNRTEE